VQAMPKGFQTVLPAFFLQQLAEKKMSIKNLGRLGIQKQFPNHAMETKKMVCVKYIYI
jgi:hypothetical protein